MKDNLTSWEWDADPDLYYRVFPEKKAEILHIAAGTPGQSLFDGLSPDDARKMRLALFAPNRSPQCFRHLIISRTRDDGTLVIMESSGTPIFDEQGEFCGFRGVERAIAAIAAETSSDQKLRLETIYANAPIALCVVDRSGRLIAANDLHSLISGPLAALVGTNVATLHPPSAIKIQQDFKILDAGGTVADHEVEINGKDYAICVTPLRDASGSVVAISVAHFDISERKRLERALAAANRQLSELSIRDHLTNVFNRRHFDEVLVDELARIKRQSGDLAVAMIDIDHFKLFNDLYGHVAGDHCLIAVADAIRGALPRTTDMIFRYGGEEFAVILPLTDLVGAVKIAEHLCAAVHALGHPHAGTPAGCVTVSIGVAALTATETASGFSPEHFVGSADAALYAAKTGGRNRVAAAD